MKKSAVFLGMTLFAGNFLQAEENSLGHLGLDTWMVNGEEEVVTIPMQKSESTVVSPEFVQEAQLLVKRLDAGDNQDFQRGLLVSFDDRVKREQERGVNFSDEVNRAAVWGQVIYDESGAEESFLTLSYRVPQPRYSWFAQEVMESPRYTQSQFEGIVSKLSQVDSQDESATEKRIGLLGKALLLQGERRSTVVKTLIGQSDVSAHLKERSRVAKAKRTPARTLLHDTAESDDETGQLIHLVTQAGEFDKYGLLDHPDTDGQTPITLAFVAGNYRSAERMIEAAGFGHIQNTANFLKQQMESEATSDVVRQNARRLYYQYCTVDNVVWNKLGAPAFAGLMVLKYKVLKKVDGFFETEKDSK